MGNGRGWANRAVWVGRGLRILEERGFATADEVAERVAVEGRLGTVRPMA